MSNEIVTLRTERLTLRPFQLQDVSAVFAYASDAEWAQYLPVPQPYQLRHAEEYVARCVLSDPAVHPPWALMLEQTIVGGIDLRIQGRTQNG